MEIPARKSALFAPKTKSDPRLELLRALDEAGRCRDDALRRFDRLTDDGMIHAAVHELEAAAARYSSLLRQAKRMGVRRTFPEAEEMKRQYAEKLR